MLPGAVFLAFFLAFGLGVLGVLAAPTLPPSWVAAPVALLAGMSFACRNRFRFAGALSGVCCGLLFAGFEAQQYLGARWPEKLADERVIALVTVDSIPAPRDTGWAFDATVEVESPQALARSLRVRLISRDPAIRPGAGERWRLLLRLRPPRGRANPGSQDLARQLFRDGIHALGNVVSATLNRRIDAGHRPLTALRERISRHIESRVADRDAAALLAALAVGDTGRVSREQWRVFNVTGTTHLVAISGLHVTLFAVIAFAASRRLWGACVWMAARVSSRRYMPEMRWARASSEASLWIMGRLYSCPRESFAAVLGFAAAAAYATLAGLSVPTQRTLIMLGTWLLARSMARVTAPLHPLFLALFAVLLLDPFAPLAAGFWLSFVAMAAIILVSSGQVLSRSVLREAVAVQAAVTVALVPFTLALFGSVSAIGPLVNALAIPAMSWVLVPLVLLSVALLPLSTSASDCVLGWAAWLHDLGWPWLAAASDMPWALLHASPPWWWYVLGVAAATIALMPWPLRLRAAAVVCVVPLAFVVDHPLRQGEVEVTALDVGEGSAVVVRTATHVLTYGVGDSYGTDGRMAESVVVPFLRSRGVRAIDIMVLGRMSASTGAGVTAVLAEMPIHQTLVGNATGSNELADCAQVRLLWDGVPLALGPDTAHACMLSISAAGGRVFIPGSGAGAAMTVEQGIRRWTVVSGRRAQRLSLKQETLTNVLSTAELGAIQFRLDAARGVEGPVAQRADKRTLWAASP